jgi:hypothetical protein
MQHVERALALHRALDPQRCRIDHADGLIKRMQSLGSMQGGTGRFSESLQQLEEAWHTGTRLGRTSSVLMTANEIASARVQMGQLPLAQAWIERTTRLLGDGELGEDHRVRALDGQAHILALSGQWGEALARLASVAQWLATRTWRAQSFLQARQAMFYAVLGRHDLALKFAHEGLSSAAVDTQLLVVEVASATIEECADVSRLLERISALDDVGLRARLTVQLAPRCEPAQVLPILAMLSTTVRQGGALGLSLSLEARACAQLAVAGRRDEAATRAQAAWQQFEQGTTPSHLLPEFAADLRLALLAEQPELARQVSQCGAQWLRTAAMTLPPMWRDNCLSRSPLWSPLSVASGTVQTVGLG